jgi:carotenoid cleavage dioxygenase-like enzyme
MNAASLSAYDHAMQHAMNETESLERGWNDALTAHPGDLDIARLEVEGTIPSALVGGRYLLNGPGWLSIGGRLVHPFDGHGYVRSLRLGSASEASLRARFVRTRAYIDEARAGKVVHRGLGTNPTDSALQNMRAPGDRNVANTTIVPWAGMLLAGWEGGSPYALDAKSLETQGQETFGGALPSGAVLAHMRVDSEAQRLVTLTLKMGRNTGLTFRELDRDGQCVRTREASIPGLLLAHDFVITPKWYVLVGNALDVNLAGFVSMKFGRATMLDAVRTKDAPRGVIYLVPRDAEGALRTITIDRPLFAVHLANAFDDAGDVVLDICAFRSFTLGHEFGYRGPHQTLDPRRSTQSSQELLRIRMAPGREMATATILSQLSCDFPRVEEAGEGHRVDAVYVAGRLGVHEPFDCIARVSLSMTHDEATSESHWRVPADCFVGEPVPVRTREGEGYVLTMLSRPSEGRSELCILRSDALQEGPIARIRTPLLPYGFHGAWQAGAP